MTLLNVRNLELEVKKKKIIKNLNFVLRKNEIISIIGPSGSGKSTILKLLAGFYQPTFGEIKLLNNLISSSNLLVQTSDRNIGLMFQEEVLFPHLSVYKNVAFGIENLDFNKKDNLVKKYLKNFGILKLLENYPDSLSGGEKQRVSLARILITKPKILLMDEPFSNLDKNLRLDICDYTIKTLKEKKISVIFVTHDIKEALRISDRIMILKEGTIQQLDTPENVYKNPINKFTASLMSDINVIKIKSIENGFLKTPFGKIKEKKKFKKYEILSGKQYICIIRPSDLYFSECGISATIIDKYFLGSSWEYKLFINKKLPLLKLYPSSKVYNKNDKIKVNVDLNKILIFVE